MPGIHAGGLETWEQLARPLERWKMRCYDDIDLERQVWTQDRGMVKELSGGFVPTHVVEDVGGTRIFTQKVLLLGRRSIGSTSR